MHELKRSNQTQGDYRQMKPHFLIVVAALLTGSVGAAMAAPEPSNPDRQTPWKLYVDSKEAYAMKQEQGDKVLLVDVRDPLEIMFTGFAPAVDVVVPYKIGNRNKFNPKKPVFLMEDNPDFVEQIGKALEVRGLDRATTPVLIMCRSGGTRGAPSARKLWGKGYEKVYVVVDGFEGKSLKEGERKNWRLVNGWKNSGLPWTYKLDPKKFPFNLPQVSQ
jgi:rhodanese-related sulfurtransferase